MLDGKKLWLVTGAAGFIGSSLVEYLLAAGQRVVGLDNLSTGSQSNLDEVLARVGRASSLFRFVFGDIRDASARRDAMAGADIVLHHAAIVSVPISIEKPILSHAINVDGTFGLLEAAREAGVRRFVYASSSAVYGDLANVPQTEEHIGRPLSPYASSKRINEIDAALYTSVYGLETFGLRYFNVFGPRQDPNGAYAAVIPHWIENVLEGKPITINGSAEITRDFCFVGDVVRANILAARCAKPSGEVLNIASGRSVTLAELLDTIRTVASAFGVDYGLEPVIGPSRTGDILRSSASMDRARCVLGYEPLYTLSDGIRQTFDFYYRHNSEA